MVRQREEPRAITSRRLPTAAWRFSPEKGRFGRLALGFERGLLALAAVLIGLVPPTPPHRPAPLDAGIPSGP
jgi:hypothetical protein